MFTFMGGRTFGVDTGENDEELEELIYLEDEAPSVRYRVGVEHGKLPPSPPTDNDLFPTYYDARTPVHIADLDGHKQKVVDVQYSHMDNRILSASPDGSAMIWEYDFSSNRWISLRLNVTKGDPKTQATAIAWSADDQHVVVASSIGHIMVFHSRTGQLRHTLEGHTADVYVAEMHPENPFIMLSAAYDGKAMIWDILGGKKLKAFANTNEQLDGRFSPDGRAFAVTDSTGICRLYELGMTKLHKKYDDRCERGQQFRYDYQDLLLEDGVVIDAGTSQPPHELPRGPVLDWGGVEYAQQKPESFGVDLPGVLPAQVSREDRIGRQMLKAELALFKSTGVALSIMSKQELYKRRR